MSQYSCGDRLKAGIVTKILTHLTNSLQVSRSQRKHRAWIAATTAIRVRIGGFGWCIGCIESVHAVALSETCYSADGGSLGLLLRAEIKPDH